MQRLFDLEILKRTILIIFGNLKIERKYLLDHSIWALRDSYTIYVKVLGSIFLHPEAIALHDLSCFRVVVQANPRSTAKIKN